MTYPLTAAKHCDRFRGIAGTSTVCSGKDSTAPRHQDLLAVQLARKLHPTQTACQDKTTVTICRTPWFRHPSKLWPFLTSRREKNMVEGGSRREPAGGFGPP